MHASFFVAQLFKNISSDNLESKMLIVNMLKELLLNCSSRDLKARPDRTEIVFNHIDNFEDTFQRTLYQELDMNKKILKNLLIKPLKPFEANSRRPLAKSTKKEETRNQAPPAAFPRS